jgi:hypothetical protein
VKETAENDRGVEGFIAGLRRCGLNPVVDRGIVKFEVLAIVGTLAGKLVPTGVSVEELKAWPATPPHWVHLPADISLARTNSQGSSIQGWLQHSREIKRWGDAEERAQAWIAHVRAVLASAI